MLAVVVSLLLPKYYRATAILLPETDKSKLSGLLGVSELASLGIGIGEASLEMLYPSIVTSEAVLKEVIYEKYASAEFDSLVNLIEYWDIEKDNELENYEEALEKVRKELDVSYERQTNVVTVSLLMKEPQLAADIVNNVVLKLDEFLRTKKISNASEQRKWIEKRMEEVRRDLAESEDSLKEFREKNRRVLDSPKLILEQERLIREVQINSTLYVELKKQLELARIEEIKNIPIINVMDPARPAAKKDKPNRALIVIFSCLASFAGVILYVVTLHSYRDEIKKMEEVVRRS